MNDVRLLYVSKFKDERYSTSELYNILTEALEFNELHKIYGALYFGNNYFVQCLEGTEEDEPYRVCRRVNILRDYPDDKIKIYP